MRANYDGGFALRQGLRKFVAKIGDKNEASQELFKQLGFKELGRSTVFREITFSVHVSSLQQELLALKEKLIYSEYVTTCK